MLLARLNRLGRKDLGIVLKIETRRGFEQLPSMLLAGMKSAGIGVMIARGDLAVECGFERMAETCSRTSSSVGSRPARRRRGDQKTYALQYR
jgi:pyruvate kinase